MKFLREKLLLFIPMILVIGFSCCKGTKAQKSGVQFENTPPFKVMNAYSQDWISGVKGGGSGTNVFVEFDHLEEGVQIETFYFNEQCTDAEQITGAQSSFVGYFKDVRNRDVIMDRDPVKETRNIPPEKIPFQLTERQLVIGYRYKGAEYYYQLNDIESKPPLEYPQAQKKGDQ